MNSILYNSFSGHLRILRCFGVHPFPNCSRFWFRVYAFTSFAIITFPLPLLNVAACYVSIKRDGDIKAIAAELFMTSQCFACIFKHFYFKLYPERIASTLEWLNRPIFNTYHKKHEEVVRNTVNFCRKVFKIYCSLVFVCYIIWICQPFFWKERSLNFKMLVPFNPLKINIVYWSCHLFQLAVVTKGAWCNVAIDTMISGLIWQAVGQIRILKGTLQDIVRQADKYTLEETTNENLTTERNKLRHLNIYENISKCVVHHVAIKEYVKELEQVYSTPLLFQLLISVLVICVSLLELTIISKNDVLFYIIISFLPAILIEIFLFCYCGEILSEESLSITRDMTTGDWLEMDLKSKKAVCLIMEGSKKPLIIKAGGLIDLSLETFQTIMRRSYSLLAVVNSFDNSQ